MTLIASLVRPNGIITFSDVMLTAEGLAKIDCPIPTMALPNEDYAIVTGNFHVAGMCRKIFRITDHICFGFTGAVAEIEPCLSKFRSFCVPGLPTSDKLKDWFDQSGFRGMKEAGCFVLAELETGPMILNFQVRVTDYGNNVCDVIGGSGADTFLRVCNGLGPLMPHEDSGNWFEAALMLTAKLFLLQHRGKHLINERFGAAFEMIGSAEQGLGFREISDVLYVFREWWTVGSLEDADICNIQTQSNIRHIVSRVYHVTHDDDITIVSVHGAEGLDAFLISPPDKDNVLKSFKGFSVKNVVETLNYLPHGKLDWFFPDVDGYIFDIDHHKISIRWPLLLPEKIVALLVDKSSSL